jgi:hypothetical protein
MEAHLGSLQHLHCCCQAYLIVKMVLSCLPSLPCHHVCSHCHSPCPRSGCILVVLMLCLTSCRILIMLCTLSVNSFWSSLSPSPCLTWCPPSLCSASLPSASRRIVNLVVVFLLSSLCCALSVCHLCHSWEWDGPF